MCIDYKKKLNKATKKYHFPLPFIDEMLEQLMNHSFCFLDGYSGYHQIPVHPNDQNKTTLHVHMENMLIVECFLDYVISLLRFKDV
jgi:hypothetical protein